MLRSDMASATTSASNASDTSVTTSPNEYPITWGDGGDDDFRPPTEPAEAERDEVGEGEALPGEAFGDECARPPGKSAVSASPCGGDKVSPCATKGPVSSPHAESLGECWSEAADRSPAPTAF